MAELSDGWALAGKVEGLLGIAAPRTLGELRKPWRMDLQARLIVELLPGWVQGHPGVGPGRTGE